MNPAMTGADAFPIRVETDIVRARRVVSDRARELGFNDFDRTRLVTAASELARNILHHAENGTLRLETAHSEGRRGLRLVFEDRGPGIADMTLALTDGFTSRRGLGLGLGGAQRLSDGFAIENRHDGGLRVTTTRWLR